VFTSNGSRHVYGAASLRSRPADVVQKRISCVQLLVTYNQAKPDYFPYTLSSGICVRHTGHWTSEFPLQAQYQKKNLTTKNSTLLMQKAILSYLCMQPNSCEDRLYRYLSSTRACERVLQLQSTLGLHRVLLLRSPLHEDIAWFLSRYSEGSFDVIQGSFDVIGHGEKHTYKRPGVVHRTFHWVRLRSKSE